MLQYDDPKWDELKGGYKVRYDPRPALRATLIPFSVGASITVLGHASGVGPSAEYAVGANAGYSYTLGSSTLEDIK